MRQERTVQASIFDLFATHEIGCELKAMSQWLDEHCDLFAVVARDLVSGRHQGDRTARSASRSRIALRDPQAVPATAYQDLAADLEDSAPSPAFARLPWSWSPQKSVLQKTISAIRPETW